MDFNPKTENFKYIASLRNNTSYKNDIKMKNIITFLLGYFLGILSVLKLRDF